MAQVQAAGAAAGVGVGTVAEKPALLEQGSSAVRPGADWVHVAVGGVPSVGDLHPTDKINCNYFDRLDTLVVKYVPPHNLIVRGLCPLSLVLWVAFA